jgi:hypothetical protein
LWHSDKVVSGCCWSNKNVPPKRKNQRTTEERLLFISYIDGERMRRGEAEEREGEERRVCQD